MARVQVQDLDSNSTRCHASVEDVLVSIGDIITHTPVFIVQGGDQDFILSHLFAHLV